MTEILPEKPQKGGHFYTAKPQKGGHFYTANFETNHTNG